MIQRLWSPRFGTNIFSRFGRVVLSYANVHVFLGSGLAGIAVLLFIYQPFFKQFDGEYYVVFQNKGLGTAYAQEATPSAEASSSAVITAEMPIVTEIAATPTPTPRPYVAYQPPVPTFVAPAFTNSGSYRSPLHVPPKQISTYYSGFHPGVDLAADSGTPIYPAADGYVTRAGWSAWGYGNSVEVDNGSGIQTLYAHMTKVNVGLGQQVTKETIIGYVGSTGHSTGPHLHFEIHRNNVPFNPLSVISPYTP